MRAAAFGPWLLVYLSDDAPAGAELRRLTAERFPPRRAGATQDTGPLDVDEGGRQGGTTPWKQDAAWKEISVGVLVGNPGLGVKGRGPQGRRAHFLLSLFLSLLCPLLRNKPWPRAPCWRRHVL